MIEVTCEQCGLKILVPPTVQGKTGICFGCGMALQVQTSSNLLSQNDLNYSVNDRVADRYVIEQKIGKGGMGIVYRAHDALVDEKIALKFMNPKMLQTEHGKKLFIHEAQIARRLRHENIVAVHDVSWTNDGILYLSMEFAEGQSLREFLRKQRADRRLIEIRFAISIVSQILAALDYAHRTVVHHDIKPENVMLMSGERVKVLDFGLARAVHEEMLDKKTQTPAEKDKKKSVVGTLAYAAPEQLKKQVVDLRADIHAVGLVMYELLTLRTPLDDPVDVKTTRPDAAPSIIEVLNKALHLEKEQRWQSAGEFKTHLDKAFDSAYRADMKRIHVSTKNKNISTEGMVHLEGGRFLMGNNDVREEAPEEEVYIDPFWMDKYPVTVEQYAEYLKETENPEPKFWRDSQYNGPDQPVAGVSWSEAKAYAEWAGKQLPTEVQWEFAARGRENRSYPWGNLPPSPTLSNHGDFLGMPSIVNMHDEGRTPEGIYDLAGNVMEWTLEPFAPYARLRQNTNRPPNAPRRAVRGGGWNSKPEDLLCTARKGLFPESREPTVGFRCVINTKRKIS